MAAAAAAGATVLVTPNVKDFDKSEAAGLGIRILSPDEFASELAHRNPELAGPLRRASPNRAAREVPAATRGRNFPRRWS